MNNSYFRLEDNLYIRGRWHLSRLCDNFGIELDAREFRYGAYIDAGPPLRASLWNEDKIVEVALPLRVSWSREGTPLDFTYTDDGMPVVTSKVAAVMAEIASGDIQRFPVKVDKMAQDFEIINVISLIDCIDAERSEIEWFEEGNEIRPDLAGTPESITKLVIDLSRVGDHHIFRPKGWDLAVIVSEVVKRAFEDAQFSGVRFQPV